MPHSQSKLSAVEMCLNITKWQAFSIFLAEEKYDHILSPPSNANSINCLYGYFNNPYS